MPPRITRRTRTHPPERGDLPTVPWPRVGLWRSTRDPWGPGSRETGLIVGVQARGDLGHAVQRLVRGVGECGAFLVEELARAFGDADAVGSPVQLLPYLPKANLGWRSMRELWAEGVERRGN